MARKSWRSRKCSISSYSPVRNLGKTCQIKYPLLRFGFAFLALTVSLVGIEKVFGVSLVWVG